MALVGAVLVVGAAVLAPRVLATGGKTPNAPQLATAARQSFPIVATTTGLVIPESQVQLNFGISGRITEIDVSVGQSVVPGQVIAKIDDTLQQAALTQAEAVLQGAEAVLQSAENPLNPSRAQSLQDAVTQATTAYNNAVAAAQALSAADAALIAQDNQRIAADQQKQQSDSCSSNPQSSVCQQDAAALRQDQNSLATDQVRQQQDAADSQLRINQTASELSAAHTNLAAGQTPSSPAVQQAEAQVHEAQGQVTAAQAAVNKCVLTAPAAGKVVSVSGQIGEQVGSGSTSAGTAPGTNAPLPTADQSGALSLGSTAFVVLWTSSTDVVAAPFSEADALRLTPGMAASLSFDAIPGVQLPSHVIAVAPSSSVVAGVVEYFATLSIDRTGPRLMEGMTTNVAVDVATVKDVLAIPSKAIYSLNNMLYVDVWYQGRAVPTVVTVGAADQKLTQITSGLSGGEQVVLSAQNGLPGEPGSSPSPP